MVWREENMTTKKWMTSNLHIPTKYLENTDVSLHVHSCVHNSYRITRDVDIHLQ